VEAADAVELRVEDRGGGVEPARASELFEPFFTTKAEGTGLGLAIARAIARAHGGDLSYARGGEVTCFSLRLPRRAAGERAA
jgi:two-component system sensor histidine kinase FlrB